MGQNLDAGGLREWWSAVGYENYTDDASAALLKSVSTSGREGRAQCGSSDSLNSWRVALSSCLHTASLAQVRRTQCSADMVHAEAWFNFEEPHADWGCSMYFSTQRGIEGIGAQMDNVLKYFQNVVDRILDLLTGDGDGEEEAGATENGCLQS